MRRRLKKIRWQKFVLFIVCVLMVWIAIFGIDIYRFSFTSDHEPADAAIVLGAAVWNGQPSPVFEERIRHAIELYQNRQVGFLIFTGGVGENDQIAESLVAARYAIENGVAVQDTYCETTSRITLENLQGAQEILDQQGMRRVLIVSDPLHMRRSVVMARDLDMDAYPSPTPTTRYTGFRTQAGFLVREIYFYSAYLIERPFNPRLENGKQMTIQPCQ
jgi:uncharacterized SAM-binding protein YcdF (DUF218 family)